MAAFTAQDVKALRDATGAGMMDAKKALVEADGDDQARQILRQKGLSKVATLEDRENNQGTVAIARDGNTAAWSELKSETDFSASPRTSSHSCRRSPTRCSPTARGAIETLADDIDTLKVSKKENIEVGKVERFEAADGNVLDTYLHDAGRSRRRRRAPRAGRRHAELAHEISLHIAFAKPIGLSRDEIDPELVAKAREGFEELTRKEGKPEQADPEDRRGSLNSWYAERVLPEQGMFGEKETVAGSISATDHRPVRPGPSSVS
jgi:elongation factor Ts